MFGFPLYLQLYFIAFTGFGLVVVYLPKDSMLTSYLNKFTYIQLCKF